MAPDHFEKAIKRTRIAFLGLGIVLAGGLIDLIGYGLGDHWLSRAGVLISLAGLAVITVTIVSGLLSPFAQLFSKQKSSS